MSGFDAPTAIVIVLGLIIIGFFFSAFATFYYMRMQKYRQYDYAFKKYGSVRERVVIILLNLVAHIIIVTAFFYVILRAIPW